MIFLWKLIKNSYNAIKNLKKLWLQAKYSNFWMPLVPIKNILPYSHNKWDKHLISSKKYLSRVPMFVSHNGSNVNTAECIYIEINARNCHTYFLRNMKFIHFHETVKHIKSKLVAENVILSPLHLLWGWKTVFPPQ